MVLLRTNGIPLFNPLWWGTLVCKVEILHHFGIDLDYILSRIRIQQGWNCCVQCYHHLHQAWTLGAISGSGGMLSKTSIKIPTQGYRLQLRKSHWGYFHFPFATTAKEHRFGRMLVRTVRKKVLPKQISGKN